MKYWITHLELKYVHLCFIIVELKIKNKNSFNCLNTYLYTDYWKTLYMHNLGIRIGIDNIGHSNWHREYQADFAILQSRNGET